MDIRLPALRHLHLRTREVGGTRSSIPQLALAHLRHIWKRMPGLRSFPWGAGLVDFVPPLILIRGHCHTLPGATLRDTCPGPSKRAMVETTRRVSIPRPNVIPASPNSDTRIFTCNDHLFSGPVLLAFSSLRIPAGYLAPLLAWEAFDNSQHHNAPYTPRRPPLRPYPRISCPTHIDPPVMPHRRRINIPEVHHDFAAAHT